MVANGETSNRISRTVEDVAGIAFGKAAFRGAGDHGITGTPAANALIGITIANYAAPPKADGDVDDAYPQYSSAGLMTQGVIWVTAGANATDGAQVYVTPGGVFTPTSSSNILLTGSFFEDTLSSGALVRIAKR